ncbi:hypothetical protein L1857_26095 [Amycolatopsis thermalba]|uniref:Secreted protein n=1 Tax=Amycolatopsis thermalba TaxID=944492 RepID=A0ABY4P0Z8_9PSEU|nr:MULTISPECIES: hypothetical protein [Amycolatopsis]UQS26035.1 hypothetical protein L1857_26095 [Amycolatopsis thermalba]
MRDKKRLLWTVLAVMLPGPWTPVVVAAYLLDRATERDQDTECDARPAPNLAPDPATTRSNPYEPPRNRTSYTAGGV